MTKSRLQVARKNQKDAEVVGPKGRADRGTAFSGRPTTVRFPTDLQKKLSVAAEVAGLSVSELMREGAEHVVDKYVGADPDTVAARIQATAEASATRMRELYGLTDGD